MYKKLLLSFLIGSCSLVIFTHWIGLYRYLNSGIGYPGKSEKFKFKMFAYYTLISTFYYGLVNMIIRYLRIKYKFNVHVIYLIASLLSGSFIIIHNLYLKLLWDSYKFTNINQKIVYSVKVFFTHFINFNFIIKGLEIYLNPI